MNTIMLSKMKIQLILASILVAALVSVSNAYAQNAEHEHEEHKNHIGFLVGSVYNVTEEKFMLGLGVEYERVLPFWNRLFGIGLAVETVFDEHKHYAVSLLLPVHPWRELTLFVAPGIMFIDEETVERRFAIHLGAEYEFELKTIFLAPEFEVAFAGDDIHLMLGVHVGFGF